MKNNRKCSNISVKKYQNTPVFGVKSGTDNLKIIRNEMLYVDYLKTCANLWSTSVEANVTDKCPSI